MADFTMHPVQSSNVHSVGHDGDALLVRFRAIGGAPGALYRYPSAGAEHVEALLAAPSAGKYVHWMLKRAHPGEPVDEPPSAA